MNGFSGHLQNMGAGATAAFVLITLVTMTLVPISMYSAPGLARSCTDMTPELEHMTVHDAQLRGPGDRRIDMKVRVADEGSERAAGFQHICPETVEHTSILFVLERPKTPRFHMHNVHMPLDIAFIDSQGIIRNIQTMHPYVLGARDTKLWGPDVPVRFVLEVKAGLFEQQGVTENKWSIVLSGPE